MGTRIFRTGAAACLLGAALLALYGPGFVGYDGSFALIWGRDLSHGHAPDIATPDSPTPHPLVNLATTLLAPLGHHAHGGLMVLSLLSFAALGIAAFAFGRALFGAAAGVIFAAIVVTRDVWVNGYFQALPDLAFMALMLGAGAVIARRPHAHGPVLLVLGLAGLIRPEAWLVGGAYALWSGWSVERTARVRGVLVAAAAGPALAWLAIDLALTGDSLHSLHGTATAAVRAGRPRGAATAIHAGPDYLVATLHPVVLWVGFAGAIAGFVLLQRQSILPGLALGLGLLGFAVLGVAGLPILQRYLYLPSLALALFAAVAVTGWRSLPASRTRRVWAIAGCAAGVALAVGAATKDRSELVRLDRITHERRRLERTLHAALDQPAAAAAVRACPPLVLGDQVAVPITAFWVDEHPGRRVYASGLDRVGRGTAVAPAATSRRPYTLDPRLRRRATRPSALFHFVAGNASWGVSSTC